MAKLQGRIPIPGTGTRPAAKFSTRYCTDNRHKELADCIAAAKAVTGPVNGEQPCVLVGIRHAYFMFRALMQNDDASLTLVPPEAQTPGAVALWHKFSAAAQGCVDHICDGGPLLMESVLEVYADFGTVAERRNALAILLDAKIATVHNAEHRRRLRRELAETPVLQYISARLSDTRT